MIINLSLSKSVKRLITGITDPVEQWELIQSTFSRAKNDTAALNLKAQFINDKMIDGKDTVISWSLRLREYQDNLANSPSDAITDRDLKLRFLIGLPDDYSDIRTSTIHSSTFSELTWPILVNEVNS